MEVENEFGNAFNMPEAHPHMENGDASMCPHMQMKNKKLKKDEENMSRDDEAESSDSDISSDEENQPRGGCPVMNNSSAKDPRLEILKPGFK